MQMPPHSPIVRHVPLHPQQALYLISRRCMAAGRPVRLPILTLNAPRILFRRFWLRAEICAIGSTRRNCVARRGPRPSRIDASLTRRMARFFNFRGRFPRCCWPRFIDLARGAMELAGQAMEPLCRCRSNRLSVSPGRLVGTARAAINIGRTGANVFRAMTVINEDGTVSHGTSSARTWRFAITAD